MPSSAVYQEWWAALVALESHKHEIAAYRRFAPGKPPNERAIVVEGERRSAMKYFTGAPNQNTKFVKFLRITFVFISLLQPIVLLTFPLWAGENLPLFAWALVALSTMVSLRVVYEYHVQLKSRRDSEESG